MAERSDNQKCVYNVGYLGQRKVDNKKYLVVELRKLFISVLYTNFSDTLKASIVRNDSEGIAHVFFLFSIWKLKHNLVGGYIGRMRCK